MKECQRRNIVLIVASQQATALWTQRDLRRGLSYRDEVTLVRERVARGMEPDGQPKKEVPRSLSLVEGSIEGEAERLKMGLDPARVLLVHSRLMQELERWVSTTDIDYVDVIDLLDEDRDLLLTWVHLAPKANRMVARAFADVILQHHRQANPG